MSNNNKLGHRWFSLRGMEDGRLVVVSNHGESQGGGCSRQFWRPVITLPANANKKEWRARLIPFVQQLQGTRLERAEKIKEFVKGKEAKC